MSIGFNPDTPAEMRDRIDASTVEGLVWRVGKRADLIRAHDTLHPDRDDCGGVGACYLMAAEVDAETDVISALDALARRGLDLTQDPVDPTTLRARRAVT